MIKNSHTHLYFYGLFVTIILTFQQSTSCMNLSNPADIKEFVGTNAHATYFQQWLNQIANPITSLIAHNQLLSHAKRCILDSNFSCDWFTKLPEGTFKMALRIMYCIEKKTCLDSIDVSVLIQKINVAHNIAIGYVNLEQCDMHVANFNYLLEFILPLLEPLIKCHVLILKLSKNNLTTLPSSVRCLTQLNNLHLDDNSLTVLPSSMSQLKMLQHVNLARNKFTQKPACLSHVSHIVLGAPRAQKYCNQGKPRTIRSYVSFCIFTKREHLS